MSFLSKGPKGISGGSQTAKTHMTTTHDETSVYEVGYLIVSSIPEEKVQEEGDAVRKIVTDAGATVIAEEAPHREQLAYTISKKNVSGGYERYDVAHFGWVKFELGSDKVEAVKKTVELRPTVLRTLLISTVRENTYLGKRAPAFTSTAPAATISGALTDEKKDVAPATIEEMDKSIDNMVKEV
jgi:ribosomal protein S6